MKQIKFSRVMVQNFGILRDALVNLPEQGGLIYVRGVNKDVPHASSNASGKSTLLNAITWGLYECDTLGNRLASAALQSGTTRCTVAIQVDCDGTPYRIARCRLDKVTDGATVHLEVRDAEEKVWLRQEEAQAWITSKFGHVRAFLACHVYAYEDGFVSYANTSDREQKSLFDRLLGFEDLETALKNTEQSERVLQRRIVRLEKGVGKLKNKLEVRKARIAAHKEYSEESKKRLKQDLLDCGYRVASLTEGLPGLKDRKARHQKTHRRAEMAFNEANDALIDYQSTLKALEPVIEAQQAKVDAVRDQSYCGVCGSEIQGNQWKEILGKTWTEYRENKRFLKDLVEKEGDLQVRKDAVAKLKSYLDFTLKRVQEIEVSEERWEQQLKEERAKYENLSKAVQNGNGSCSADAKKAWQIASMIQAMEEALKECYDELSVLTFWKEGFGRNGIRAYRLEQVTPRLNEIAEEYSTRLFGDGTTVVYSTQAKLKTGEYRDRFSVTLQKEGVLVERPSAGQAARRDLIHLLCIATASREINSSGVMLLALDEAFRTVDAAGVQAAIELLRMLTQDFGTIIVIEHDPELEAMFDSVIEVIRKDNVATAYFDGTPH